MLHKTPVRWSQRPSDSMFHWWEGLLDNKNIFIDTKLNTHTLKYHLDNFPANFISTFLEVLVCWLWSLMSCSIRVCDAADDKEQLRCRRWDAGHAEAYTSNNKRSFFPNLPSTFITFIHAVNWFMAYKCHYRGEALGFWTWLCKNYLHNQVVGRDFHGSDDMKIFLYRSHSLFGSMRRQRRVHLCQTLAWILLVKAACPLLFIHHDLQDTPIFSFIYQYAVCDHNCSLLIQSRLLIATNDIQGQI